MSEDWAAIEEQRKKHEEELEAKIAEYMEQRREQREREDEELEELKAHQAERKAERAREMDEMAERMREAEERRRQDEELKKAQIEAEREARLERKRKTGGTSIYDVFGRGGGPKETKKDTSEEEKAEMKSEYLSTHTPKVEEISGLGTDDLKAKIKDWHARICKLEADRYDLEMRQKAQEYDLKELQDRQSQAARNAALKMGLDAEEAAKSKHPPKVKVVAKFDRQIDRRGYGERKDLYEKGQMEKVYKVFHGSGRPPTQWGRRENEELENLRKTFEGFKYQEVEPLEGAKAPAPFIPAKLPEGEAFDEVKVKGPEPPGPGAEPIGAAPAADPEPAAEAAAEEEEEEEE